MVKVYDRKRIQLVNKQVKRYTKSLIIKEMKIKTRYHFTYEVHKYF